MKSILQKVDMKKFAIIIALFCSLASCSEELENSESAVSNSNQETELSTPFEIESEEENSDSEELNYDLPDQCTSVMRPGENLELGKTYLDTVNYVSFNDDADYWLIIAEKNKDTFSIICHDFYDFPPGESLIIEWKIDSFRHAGDPEFLNFNEFLVSLK